jgi:hypothetical protein
MVRFYTLLKILVNSKGCNLALLIALVSVFGSTRHTNLETAGFRNLLSAAASPVCTAFSQSWPITSAVVPGSRKVAAALLPTHWNTDAKYHRRFVTRGLDTSGKQFFFYNRVISCSTVHTSQFEMYCTKPLHIDRMSLHLMDFVVCGLCHFFVINKEMQWHQTDPESAIMKMGGASSLRKWCPRCHRVKRMHRKKKNALVQRKGH